MRPKRDWSEKGGQEVGGNVLDGVAVDALERHGTRPLVVLLVDVFVELEKIETHNYILNISF